MKTIFPTILPTIDGKQHGIPVDILFPRETIPNLTPAEWLFLLYFYTDPKGITGEELKKWKKRQFNSLGSRTTLWRIRRGIKEKGYEI